jgi:hypothetical protein
MSFEGFYQKLCKKGHYFEEDVYSIESKVCPVCDSEIVFTNMVDITNGSYDEDENRIDGYMDFEIATENKCGRCGSILERTYKLKEQ